MTNKNKLDLIPTLSGHSVPYCLDFRPDLSSGDHNNLPPSVSQPSSKQESFFQKGFNTLDVLGTLVLPLP